MVKDEHLSKPLKSHKKMGRTKNKWRRTVDKEASFEGKRMERSRHWQKVAQDSHTSWKPLAVEIGGRRKE